VKIFIILVCVFQIQLSWASPSFQTKNDYITLSPEELKVFNIGPLSDARYITGGTLGTVIGFGMGHVVQGRWQDKGWIFSAGQSFSLVMAAGATVSCISDSLFDNFSEQDGSGSVCILANIALAGFFGLKVWEIIDLWHGGSVQRTEFKRLKLKMGLNAPEISYKLVPMFASNNVGLGLNIRF
jgi:hypothetical protein